MMKDQFSIEADDATLENAVREANLPVLMTTLAYLSGDMNLIRGDIQPQPGGIGDVDGGLSQDEEERLRERALEGLKRIRDGAGAMPGMPAPEAFCELMSFCAGEPVDQEYLGVVLEETGLGGDDPRRVEWTQRPADNVLESFHVLIIGAGLAGVLTAIRMRQLDIPYTVIEKNQSVGGTWLENSYPDCRVDIPNHFYSYSFESNDWSECYAHRDELKAYVENCASKFGLVPRIRFDTEVVAAAYDEDRKLWRVDVRSRDGHDEFLEANVLVSGVGMLNRPNYPDIDGLDSFEGPCFHSSRWEHERDLTGRRVGVIGTGASAMQFVPTLAGKASHVEIFQRSAQWAILNPTYHRSVGSGKQWLLKNLPGYASWYRFVLFWNVADRVYPAFRRDPDWQGGDDSISLLNDAMRKHLTDHIREQIGDDPELLKKVLPDYPPLGKRMLMDNGWFKMLTRDDVSLCTDPIIQIDKSGIVTEDGTHHDLDAIVLSTGFKAGRFLRPMKINGRSGVDLQDLWGENPRAYLGITVPQFPNMFCLYGPNTNPVTGSVIFMLECQVRYLTKCVVRILENGFQSIECRQDVHDDYNQRLDAEHENLVWRQPLVESYYNNSEGRVTTNYAWRLIDYWNATHEPEMSDFEWA